MYRLCSAYVPVILYAGIETDTRKRGEEVGTTLLADVCGTRRYKKCKEARKIVPNIKYVFAYIRKKAYFCT